MILEGKEKISNNLTYVQKQAIMKKANNILLSSLGCNVLRLVSRKKTINKLWEKLESQFIKKIV